MKSKIRELMSSQEELREDLEGNDWVANVEISEEEADILLDEAVAELSEADVEIVNVKRVEDLVDALEDMAQICEGIESATHRETLLIETGLRMAVAGTDLKVDDLMPGLEDQVNKGFDISRIKETIRRLWEGIKKAVLKVWEKIAAFFKRIMTFIPTLRIAVDWLRRGAEERVGRTPKLTDTYIGSEANTLARDYKVPKNENDIIDGLKEIEIQGKVIFGKYLDGVKRAGEGIARAMDKYKADSSEESLNAITDAALSFDLENLAKLTFARKEIDRRFDKDAIVYKSQPLPGNRSIFFVQDISVPASALGRAEFVRNRRVELMTTRETAYESVKGTAIKTITPQATVRLCNMMLGIFDMLEGYYKQAHSKVIMDLEKRVRESTERLTKRIENDRNLSHEAVAHYRSAANFNSAFARWANYPHSTLASLSISACRGVIAACKKSMKNYDLD